MAGRFSVETVFKAIDRVTAPVTRFQNAVGKFTRSAERGLRNVNSALDKTIGGFTRGAQTVAKYGAVAIGAIGGAVTYLITQFSKVEDAEAAFTPILGGAEKARAAVEALNKEAASTPFQFEDLASAANQLLPVMDGDVQRVIKTIRMLGDTAGGNAQKLDTITRGFTKAMLKGKVDMESLNMIAEAGVPIFQDLAAVMGTKVGAKFFKQISAGRVTTDQLAKAFERLTSKGGKFFNGMEIASKTTSGMWSTLTDNISLAAAELGSVLAPTVKELIGVATEMAIRAREWVKANRELVEQKFLAFVDNVKSVLVGAGKAFAFMNRNSDRIIKVIATVVALSLVLKALSAVLMIVNLVMLANPIGLIVLGVLALIAAVATAVLWWDELKAAFESLPGPVKAVLKFLLAPVIALVAAAKLLMDNWEPIRAFFADLWGGIVSIFNSSVDRIMSVIDTVKQAFTWFVDMHRIAGGALGAALGLTDADETTTSGATQMVSPQARMARSIEETRSTSSAEVTIRDDTGRAAVTKGSLGPLISLQPTGGF